MMLLLTVFGIALGIFHRELATTISSSFASETQSESAISIELILFSFIALFPINIILGGTIPLLVRIDEARFGAVGNAGAAFGPIYAAETLGAATGALATGLWSIQSLGLRNTLFLVSALCGVAFVTCRASFLPIRRDESKRIRIDDGLATKSNTATNTGANFGARWILLVVVAFASCSSLAMEVIWQRLFVIVFGSDTHSLAITTAAYLIGIAIGALLANSICRRSVANIKLYGMVLVGIAVTLLLATLAIFAWIQNEDSIVWTVGQVVAYPILARFLFAFFILVIPATAIGVGLPLAASIWINPKKKLGQGIGELYASALVGNIAGVLASGYLLVPAFGLRGSAVLLSLLCLAGGIGVMLFGSFLSNAENGSTKVTSRFRQMLLAVSVVFWIALAVHLLNRDETVGTYSDRLGWQVDSYREAAANTVAVISSRKDPDVRKMLIDGVSIGESGGGVDEKQQLLAHLPFLLRPDATKQNVLTIGLGTGILAGELLENDLVAQVCCVEISPAVIEAAELFSDLNHNAIENERLDLVRADGVTFLRNQNRQFDVIVSDAKSRPGHAGNVNFFSREYYQLCSQRLTEDGMFVQWIALNTSARATEIILRTFCESFPHGHVAIAAPGSLFVVGSRSPLQLDQDHIERYLAKPAANSLRQYEWKSYHDMLSMYWLDQESLVRSRLSDIAVNSFDRPLLESTALQSYHYEPQTTGNLQLRKLRSLIQFDLAGDIENSLWNGEPLSKLSDSALSDDLINGRLGSIEVLSGAIAYSERKSHWLDAAAEHYQHASELLPELTRQAIIADGFRVLADNAKRDSNVDAEFSALAHVDELKAAKASELFRMGEILVEIDQAEKSLDFFFRAAKIAPEQPNYQAELGFAMLRLQRLHQAKFRFEKILKAHPEHSLSMLGLGIAVNRGDSANDSAEGIRLIKKALTLQPELADRYRQTTDTFEN